MTLQWCLCSHVYLGTYVSYRGQTLQNWIMQACTVEVPDIGEKIVCQMYLCPFFATIGTVDDQWSTASYKQCS